MSFDPNLKLDLATVTPKFLTLDRLNDKKEV